MAQVPFLETEGTTPTNDNIDKDNKDNTTDGWDYKEYDDYIAKLGDDIEGVDE
jgi:hypothetical protein